MRNCISIRKVENRCSRESQVPSVKAEEVGGKMGAGRGRVRKKPGSALGDGVRFTLLFLGVSRLTCNNGEFVSSARNGTCLQPSESRVCASRL